MKNKKNYWFTTSELLIVLSLLAILASISFFSFTWYSKDARDSARITDIKNINASLETFYFDAWFYPEPSNSSTITYSWAEVWKQGTFWDSAFKNVRVLSSLPLDPYLDNEYSYSLLNDWIQMQLVWALEASETVAFNYNKTNAATPKIEANAYVVWNYNWLLAKVSTWWTTYVLTTPSITVNDLSSLDLIDIVNNWSFVYDNYTSLPDTYRDSKFITEWDFDFNTNNLVVFSWSLIDLENWYFQVNFLKNLQEAYSWSIIAEKDFLLSNLWLLDVNILLPSYKVKLIACDTIKYKLNYDVACDWLDYIATILEEIIDDENVWWGWGSSLASILFNLPGDDINAIFRDSAWSYWFWTDEWIAYYNWSAWQIFDEWNSGLIDDEVTWITEDLAWNYWFWTEGWISQLAPDLLAWTNYTNAQIGLKKSDIQYIYTSDNWTVWIWTEKKWAASFVEWSWDVYTKKDEWLSTNKINAIFEDSSYNVWFWTDNKWVDKMVYVSSDPLTYEDDIINYKKNNTWRKLPDNEVNYILEDNDWKMWFWTEEWIWILDSDWTWLDPFTKENTTNWLYKDDISYIFEDSLNNIWIWTDAWVWRYDWSTWTHYWKSDSWTNKLKSDEIISIFEDSSGNILILWDEWMDTIDTSLNVNPVNP